MNLTNNLRKYVKSLHLGKYRQKYNKFIAEGPKICSEFLSADKYQIEYLFCTQQWADDNPKLVNSYASRLIISSDKDHKTISALHNANNTLIVAERHEPKQSAIELITDNKWTIYLDRIQDPGNMGTILRIADWYGINAVISTPDSVDFYNPKVVQSAMGAHNRISMLKSEVTELPLKQNNSIALVLDGTDINNYSDTKAGGIIVIGNESSGISEQMLSDCRAHLSIMRKGGAESLNAAVACGIACHQLISGD